MLKFTNIKIASGLKKSLALSITKKNLEGRMSSVAISKHGNLYYGGVVESDTNIFNISPEQVVITLSTMSTDYGVSEIVTMIEQVNHQDFISPINLKIMRDYSIRTGNNIKYSIIDAELNILFTTKKINELLPYYQPAPITLVKIKQKPTKYFKKIKYKTNEIKNILKKYSLKGLGNNFPLYDSASGYGTSILTKNNKIFFSGQYSSPDKRLGLHSEVSAILGALMNQENQITHIGLVSSKYKDSPCHMCGNCRQFLSEMAIKYNFSPKIFLLAKDNDEAVEYNIDAYLPNLWTSKKWS